MPPSRLRPRSASITMEFKGSKRNPYTLIRQQLKDVGVREAHDVLFKEADKMASEVQLALLQQTLKHTPLSPKYLEWKKRNGLDQRILIAEGHYVSEIKARRKNKEGEKVIEVGLPDAMHPTANMPYKQLARIHEYGSAKRNIPARPHWGPMTAKFNTRVPRIRKMIQDRVNHMVFKQVSRRLGKTTKVTKRR